MILKVVSIQPVFDSYKRDLHKSKDGSTKKKSCLFASILENIIKSHPNENRVSY